jgi:hypothetical protein
MDLVYADVELINGLDLAKSQADELPEEGAGPVEAETGFRFPRPGFSARLLAATG